DKSLDMEDFADDPFVYDLANGEEIRIPAAILIDCERQSALHGGAHECIGLGGGQAERLLDDDVLAGLEQLARECRVGVGWRANHDGIDLVLYKQVDAVRGRCHTRERLARSLQARTTAIANERHLQSWRLGDGGGVLEADGAIAQQCNTHWTRFAPAGRVAQRPEEELPQTRMREGGRPHTQTYVKGDASGTATQQRDWHSGVAPAHP